MPTVTKSIFIRQTSITVIVAGAYSTAERTATSQVNVACPLACLLSRFQVAWITAATSISVRAEPVMDTNASVARQRVPRGAQSNRRYGSFRRSQPTAMNQTAHHTLSGQFFQM